MLRLKRRAGQRAGVCARDRDGVISLLAWRGRDVFGRRGRGFEATLLNGRRGVLNLDGRRLQCEGFRLGEGLVLLGELSGLVFTIFGGVDRVVMEMVGERMGHG